MGFAADGIYSSGADQGDNCHNPSASFSPYQHFISNLSMPSPLMEGPGPLGTTVESLPHGICLWKKTFFLLTLFHFQCPTSLTPRHSRLQLGQADTTLQSHCCTSNMP